MNLKPCVFFVNIMCIMISMHAFQLFLNEPRNNTWDCGSVVFARKSRTHTIVLDTTRDDWRLHNCLSLLPLNMGRIIFTGDYMIDMKTKIKLKFLTYNIPNIVIYTRSLSNFILTNTIAAILFQSHWSIVNIVVVNNATYACEDGYFSSEVNSSIYKFLNNIWKTYQLVYVVVEYPDDCPNKFSMYDGNKQLSHEGGQLYERTFKSVRANDVQETMIKSARNLTHNYPLKAHIFYRFPSSITDCANLNSFVTYNSNLTNGYCGLDALVMHDVMQFFKFNATFEMQTTTNYGYVQSGRVTGTLGLIVRGEIDISFNSRFMVLYSLNKNSFHFLFHIWADSLCALIKEPNAVPLWHYPFNICGITTWIFLLTCLTLVGSMMYVKSKLFRTEELKFYVYSVNAVWSGLFGFFFNKKIKRSLLAALCLLCSVVLTAKYQGHVNYMFATLVRYDRLKTLQQMGDNGFQVYTSPSIAILLGQGPIPNNPKTTLLHNLKTFPDNESATEYVLNHPKTATIERSDLLLQTMFNLTDKEGRPLLYAANECFEHYYLSYIVRPGFLFTSHLQVLIMKIVEAGLPTVYYKWTRYTYKVVDPVTKSNSEPRPSIRITIYEQRVAFAVLLLGYLLSIAVFAAELWVDMRTKRAMNGILQTYID